MANVFSSLGTIPIMETVQGMLQRQADIARTNASAQLIDLETQQRAQQIQSQKKFQEGVARLADSKQAQDRSEQGLSPDFQAFGNTTMGKPIIDGYRSENQIAQQNWQLAKVAVDSGDYALQKQYEQQAREADNRARTWYAEGLKLQAEQRKEAASAAGSYSEDGSNLQQVVDAVQASDPNGLRGAQFNRDDKGNIVPGDRTTKAFAALADKNMTRSEQLAAKREADKIKSDAARRDMENRRQTEREKKDDVQIAALQHGMAVSDRRLAMAEKDRAAAQDQSSLESDGAMVATGMPLSQAIPGWGTAAVNKREAAKKEAINQIKSEMGVDDKQAGRELAQRQIDYFAGRRSTTQLNTMLGATRQAVSQLEYNVDQTKKILKDIPSTDLSPLLNSLVRGEERWTGDPRYSSLYFYMHAVAMESARILQGGQASIAQLHQGAAEEAKKWADIGLTPKMFDSVANAIVNEGHARIKTYQDAMGEQRVSGRPAESAPTALPASGSGKTVDWSELK